MNEIKIINQREVLGKGFKMYGTFDEPLFLAKHVAEWIEYDVKNTYRLLNSVDEEEKVKGSIHTLGGTQEMWFLTEDGLYEVLMQSRKPIAKAFKKEVKGILKKLRKGNLNVPSYQIDNPIERAKVWIGEEGKRQQLQLEVKEKEELLIEQASKVEAFDVLTGNTDSLYTTGQIAANYGMSAIKMNSLLHNMGVQYKQSGVWKLYAKYEGNGYTATPTGLADNGHTFKNMKWTNKGEYFLYNLLKEHGYTSQAML